MENKATVYLLILIFLSNYVIVTSSSCQPIVDSIRSLGHVYTHNSICYVFLEHEKTWVDARHQCETWGGDLVQILDKSTMDFLKRVMDNQLRWKNNGVWIGLHSRGGGGWRWTTGKTQTYNYWEPGQPSRTFGIFSLEDCACMRRNDNWKWHDYMCDNDFYTYKYICQFRMLKPTTTTTSTTTTTTAATTTMAKTTTSTTSSISTEPYSTTSKLPFKVIHYKRYKIHTSEMVHDVIHGINPDSSIGIEVASKIGRSQKDEGLSDTSKGAIIGLVLGGFIVLVVSCMIFILFRKRRRRKRESDNLVVHFENTDYMHGYTQGYSPVSQNEQNGHLPNGRPESHVYMDTNEMNRLYEQVTKQVDHGVNSYDQLKPKTGACCAEPPEGETDECCEESDLKREKVALPEGSSCVMNNSNDYVDMGANRPKLTNIEANTRRLEKQNNLQQSEPIYNNTVQRDRLDTPTEDQLETLEYEESMPFDNGQLEVLDYEESNPPVKKENDHVYDIVH